MKSDLNIPEMIGISAFIFMLAAVGAFLSERKIIIIPAFLIIAVSVIIRLVFLNSEPSLSDDIHRYVFDGKMVISGINPYSASPARVANLYPGMKSFAAKINHPDLVTIYPPTAQLVFAAGSFIAGMNGIRLFLILLDSATILMMMGITKKSGISASMVLFYAWNPLVIMETASSGHIDSVAVFFMISAIYLLRACAPSKENGKIAYKNALKVFAAGASLALSFLVKLLPVMFMPLFLIYAGTKKSKIFISGFISTIFMLVFPFMPDIQNCLKTLDIYARNWEFSGFIFRQFRHMTGNGNIARVTIIAAFAGFALLIYRQSLLERISNAFSPDTFNTNAFFRYSYCLSLLYLLLTPTLHPWYAIYLAAVLPFVPGVAGICMTFGVLLSYRVLILYRLTGQWTESDLVAILIFSAPVAASASGYLINSIFCRDSKDRHKQLTS